MKPSYFAGAAKGTRTGGVPEKQSTAFPGAPPGALTVIDR